MKPGYAFAVVEGALEVPATRRLLEEVGMGSDDLPIFDKGGRGRFWKDIRRYNQAAEKAGPVFGLADLETFPCPSGLIEKHLRSGCHRRFVLRIAERMLESWFLADPALAAFLGVQAGGLPQKPDEEPDPKRLIVTLARRSPSRELRLDLVPSEGSLGVVGKGYTPRMTEFIEQHWRPRIAAKRSESLRRALAAIRRVPAA